MFRIDHKGMWPCHCKYPLLAEHGEELFERISCLSRSDDVYVRGDFVRVFTAQNVVERLNTTKTSSSRWNR